MKGYDHIFMQNKLKQDKSFSIKPMLVFFVPLALTALLTTVTHTLFNAGLGRLSQPEIYISAFAVAKSLMHLFESPISMLRQTYSTLVVDQNSMHKVRKFCARLILLLAVLFAIFIYSPISYYIFTKMMNLSGDTLSAAITILRILFFFPIFSAIRNYYQGILIKFRATRLITLSTIGRIIFVSLFIMVIGRITIVSESALAGLMFLTALLVEAGVLIIGTKMVIGNPSEKILFLNQLKPPKPTPALTYRTIFTFIGPLIAMGIIRSLGTPIINAGLGQTYAPEIALSAYAVGWGLGNIVISPLGSFHQIPISFMSEAGSNRKSIKLFGLIVAIFSAVCLGLAGYTNIGRMLLTHWIKAPVDIIEPCVQVLQWMVIYPFIVIMREFYWGMLMYKRKTKYLSVGKFINVLALTAAMFLVSTFHLPNPALVGVIGVLVSEVSEILFLFYVSRRERGKTHLLGTTAM